MVELLSVTRRRDRDVAMREGGYNTFLLPSDRVYIDLLTDSGTSAMSDRQWAGMMMGDEAYAGSRNFYSLEATVREFYGYRHLVPTHQGRGADQFLVQRGGGEVHVFSHELAVLDRRLAEQVFGATFVDVIVDEAHDPRSPHPFKGNLDLDKLQKLIRKVGAGRIAYVSMAGTVNMAGGQPISMANLRAVRILCDRHKIRIFLDATRLVENAFFIQEREKGYAKCSLAAILREFCSYSDGACMSGKKDHLVNIGGWLAVNDDALFDELRNIVVIYEGLHTYGGLAGRDLEAMAIGIRESINEDHMRSRIGQVRYLGGGRCSPSGTSPSSSRSLPAVGSGRRAGNESAGLDRHRAGPRLDRGGTTEREKREFNPRGAELAVGAFGVFRRMA